MVMYMDRKCIKLIIGFVLFLGLILFSWFLLKDNHAKSQKILDLQSKISDLEFDNLMYKQATSTEFIDFKKSSGTVDVAFLYQDKEIISRHGIGLIIDNQDYRIGVNSENNIPLDSHSKIISINKNIIEFECIFNNKTTFFRLTIDLQKNSTNFKLDELAKDDN